MIHPANNRILVRPVPNIRSQSIFIPPTVRQDMTGAAEIFHVLSVGPKVKEIAQGDRILAQFIGSGAEDVGDGCKLISENHVIAILEAAK